MANLKQDLLNDFGNEKFYAELELVRLAQDPNMNYKDKVNTIKYLIDTISKVDLGVQLVGKYFPEQPAPEVVTEEKTKEPKSKEPEETKPLPGQSHGE
jgi:hypothetical protein